MENANLYEEGAMDCIKAFHMWQLNVPLNCHVVPYDIWREAWIAAELNITKQVQENDCPTSK